MEALEVVDLLRVLEALHVDFWVDGGWGVDCLLREQTRPHGDLDLVVARPQLENLEALLASRGFQVIRDWRPTTIAFRDDAGREIDLHLVDATDDGGGDQVLTDGSTWHYSAPVEGSIAGHLTRCASAQDQVHMHLGYEPRPVDLADVRRIAERFHLEVPASLS